MIFEILVKDYEGDFSFFLEYKNKTIESFNEDFERIKSKLKNKPFSCWVDLKEEFVKMGYKSEVHKVEYGN